MNKSILIIDNYDSFTYNLYQLAASIGHSVKVVRNDKITCKNIEKEAPLAVIISPGPGRPENAGISVELVNYFGGKIPILGICLGHQAIAYAFGGRIIRAGKVFHGKTSRIYHCGDAVFAGIDSPLMATRYHSLIVEKESLPKVLKVIAWTDDGTIMGIRHITYPIVGLQFHPESILTQYGDQILRNFLERCGTCQEDPDQLAVI
ncbi:MAG: aminodeoxychorismate/anthranilate synthase component II [Candidatus Marinimicrobia bacterium]|nr:aminodeoxychorismate/anthranilate synthase component II [Candidatus Neomarinimicrobiota bacterium]